MRNTIYYFIFSCLIFQACSKNHSDSNELPDSIIVNFQANLLIIQEENRLMGNDSTLKHRIDSLYHYYQVTEQEVENTIHYLKSDLNIWRDFNEKMVKRLEYLQMEESKKKNE
ncbi:MAG: hypothetical protein QME52_07370 [Bacteroidota bacterium]|nr:hypothetical protein [Bacteroidota bacterium]